MRVLADVFLVLLQVRNVYVKNLNMNTTTEERLKEIFSQFGEVYRVQKIKDFAFIYYEKREQALKAIEEMNGREVDDVIIEVTLAKPLSERAKEKRREQRKSRSGPRESFFDYSGPPHYYNGPPPPPPPDEYYDSFYPPQPPFRGGPPPMAMRGGRRGGTGRGMGPRGGHPNRHMDGKRSGFGGPTPPHMRGFPFTRGGGGGGGGMRGGRGGSGFGGGRGGRGGQSPGRTRPHFDSSHINEAFKPSPPANYGPVMMGRARGQGSQGGQGWGGAGQPSGYSGFPPPPPPLQQQSGWYNLPQ